MATKIKDGLFIGDAEASQDPEFIELNKVMFVINCAGRQLPNLWEQHGLHYLTFPWTSESGSVLFDVNNVIVVQIFNFINEALEKGDSVLVHSLDGTGRCIACVAAYLMCRYRWGVEKALEFLCSKRPDAAPNTGFVQQLHKLDMRLSTQRYGKEQNPPEIDRLRHDQWIPIVPSTSEGCQEGSWQASTSYIAPNKSGGSLFDPRAVNGRIGVPAPAFSFLGRLGEVQEEEIVLVHSFLNSQPQIDALPPGRTDYEDHVSKKLHWIDLPRLDKLSATCGLGHRDRWRYNIPVSPRTGRAVPERPGNSSYNALSRDTPAVSRRGPLVGILKNCKKEWGGANYEKKKKPCTHTLDSEAPCPVGGSNVDDAVIFISTERGGGDTKMSMDKGSLTAKLENEVVVEDLIDGIKPSKTGNENGSDEDLPADDHMQRSRLSSKRTDKSSAEEEAVAGGTDQPVRGPNGRASEDSVARNETPGRGRVSGCKNGNDSFLLDRSVENSRGSSTTSTRQAWGCGKGFKKGVIDCMDKEQVQTASPRSGEKHFTTPQWRALTRSSECYRGSTQAVGKLHLRKEIKSSGELGVNSKGDEKDWRGDCMIGTTCGSNVGDDGVDPADVTIVGVANATKIQRMLRGGSEGSLNVSPATEISTLAKRFHGKHYLPQAESGMTSTRGNPTFTDTREPCRSPAEVQLDELIKKDQRTENGENSERITTETFLKENAVRRRDSSEKQQPFYTRREGGRSLQQLAKTPNPQQRRLLSTRFHEDNDQDPGPLQTALHFSDPLQQQVSRRQNAPGSDYMFPQKRPTSAPLQRPNDLTGNSSGCRDLNNDWVDDVVNDHEPGRSGGDARWSTISSGPRSLQISEDRGARRGSGGSSIAGASCFKSGVAQQNVRSLPLPSTNTDNTGGDEIGGICWKNLGGRYGDAGGPQGTKSYPGSTGSRGSACNGGSGSTRVSETYPSSTSHRLHGHQCSAPRLSRAGGAPLYRSGSPAPTRGRRRSGAGGRSAEVATGATSGLERFSHRPKRNERYPQQATRIPPEFRGYIAPSIGGGGHSSGRVSTASCQSQIRCPTAREKRHKEAFEGVARQYVPQRDSAQRENISQTIQSRVCGVPPRQRPSTSDRLSDRAVGVRISGRKESSPSPAPRPSSASVRRRPSIPSAENAPGSCSFGRSTSRMSIPIDASLERPRWK